MRMPGELGKKTRVVRRLGSTYLLWAIARTCMYLHISTIEGQQQYLRKLKLSDECAVLKTTGMF